MNITGEGSGPNSILFYEKVLKDKICMTTISVNFKQQNR